jgi:hypothetical protein
MAIPPATISSRFFGLMAESTKPNPPALGGVTFSMVVSHFGSEGCSVPFGRFRQSRTPTSNKRTPSPTLIHETVVVGPEVVCSVAVPATATTTEVTMAMPATHPIRKDALLAPARFDRSMRMMAMIGMGLMATPMASGSESPMACPITDRLS